MNIIMLTICICCLVTIITALCVKAYKNNPKRLKRLLEYANKYYVAHSNEAYKLKNKLNKTDEDIAKEQFHTYCAKMAEDKLKHITGFSKLFENTEYKKAWESKRQILLRVEAEKQQQGK